MNIIIEIRKMVQSVDILTKLMQYAHYIIYICLIINFIDTFAYLSGVSTLILILFWVAVILLLAKGDLKNLTIAFGVSAGIYLVNLIYFGAKYHSFPNTLLVYMIFAGLIAWYIHKKSQDWPDGQILFPTTANESINYKDGGEADINFCPYCGVDMSGNQRELKFCPKCGKEIASKQPVHTSSNQYVAAASPQPVSSQSTNVGEKPSKEYIKSLIEEAENGKSNGTKRLVGGVVMIVIWMICFFTPAIWTNLIFFIIAGPILIVVGIVGIASNSSKIERYTRELRQY